jgi:hypothetical protein
MRPVDVEALRGHTPGPYAVFVGNANGRGLIRIETDASAPIAGVHIASMPRGEQSGKDATLLAASSALLAEVIALRKENKAQRAELAAKDAAVAELVKSASEVESTEREYWNMPPSRNPERYAERHDEAKQRLYSALANFRGAK